MISLKIEKVYRYISSIIAALDRILHLNNIPNLHLSDKYYLCRQPKTRTSLPEREIYVGKRQEQLPKDSLCSINDIL